MESRTYFGDDLVVDEGREDKVGDELDGAEGRAERLRREHEAREVQDVAQGEDEEACAIDARYTHIVPRQMDRWAGLEGGRVCMRVCVVVWKGGFAYRAATANVDTMADAGGRECDSVARGSCVSGSNRG